MLELIILLFLSRKPASCATSRRVERSMWTGEPLTLCTALQERVDYLTSTYCKVTSAPVSRCLPGVYTAQTFRTATQLSPHLSIHFCSRKPRELNMFI